MTPGPTPQSGDAGATLIETVVAMSVLSVVTAIATTGIIGSLREQRAAVAYTEAQTQAARALQRMDREVRYAGDLAVLSGPTARAELPDPSLVWVAIDPDSPTSALRCVAVSLRNNTLQRRTWAAGPLTGVVAQVAPTVLVSGVRAVAGQPPFAVTGGHTTVVTDGEPVGVDRAKVAEITLEAVAGDGVRSRPLLQSFVAPNSRQGTYVVGTQCF